MLVIATRNIFKLDAKVIFWLIILYLKEAILGFMPATPLQDKVEEG